MASDVTRAANCRSCCGRWPSEEPPLLLKGLEYLDVLSIFIGEVHIEHEHEHILLIGILTVQVRFPVVAEPVPGAPIITRTFFGPSDLRE